MNSDQSPETIAMMALGWIAAQDDLTGVFLGSSGLSADDIRTRAQDPEFLASVLDFLTMDDQWVIGFCDVNGLPYEAPLRARQALPGGALPNWT